jgi:hypothetical protein
MVSRGRSGRAIKKRSATVSGNRARESWHARTIISRIASRSKRCVFWVEDHAERVIGTVVALWLLAASGLLLWKWAQVISLAVQLAAVITIVLVTITIASAVLRWLRRRRDNRHLPGVSDSQPEVQSSTSAPLLDELVGQDEGAEGSRSGERG